MRNGGRTHLTQRRAEHSARDPCTLPNVVILAPAVFRSHAVNLFKTYNQPGSGLQVRLVRCDSQWPDRRQKPRCLALSVVPAFPALPRRPHPLRDRGSLLTTGRYGRRCAPDGAVEAVRIALQAAREAPARGWIRGRRGADSFSGRTPGPTGSSPNRGAGGSVWSPGRKRSRRGRRSATELCEIFQE